MLVYKHRFARSGPTRQEGKRMTALVVNTIVRPSFVIPADANCEFTALFGSAAYKPETQPQRQHSGISNPIIWQDKTNK